jgi:hypothetical protein
MADVVDSLLRSSWPRTLLLQLEIAAARVRRY